MTAAAIVKPSPACPGALGFSQQLAQEAYGLPLLRALYTASAVLGLRAFPATPVLQGKGVDHVLRLAGCAYSIGSDLKADTYLTPNLTLELFGADRGPRSRPVLGWPYKRPEVVEYLFVRSGDLVLLPLVQVRAWLEEQWSRWLAEDAPGPVSAWLTGTPNPRYISYNLVLPVETLLRACPEVRWLRLPSLQLPALAGQTWAPTALPGLPVEQELALDGYVAWLRTVARGQLDSAQSVTALEERVRFCERHARFRADRATHGRALQAQRERYVLTADLTPT